MLKSNLAVIIAAIFLFVAMPAHALLVAVTNIPANVPLRTVADVDAMTTCADTVIAYTSISAPRTVTVTPCGAPGNLKFWRIKDRSGSASVANPINIVSSSGTVDTFAGASISTGYGSKSMADDGTNFFMVSGFLPSPKNSSALQKADGNGGFLNATAGTDFLSPGALSAYVPTSTTINGYALNSNVSLNYSDLLNLPAIPAAQVQSDYAETTTSAADYIKNKPVRMQSSATRSITASTGAAGFQVSSTRDAVIKYNATVITSATLVSSAVGTVVLEICPTNSATPTDWVECGRVTNGQAFSLAVAIGCTQTICGELSAYLPAGYYAKLRSISTAGSPTFTYNSGQETLL